MIHDEINKAGTQRLKLKIDCWQAKKKKKKDIKRGKVKIKIK